MSDGKLIIETELGTKTFDSQYAELESKLKRDQKRLNELMKVKSSGGDIDYAGLNSEIVQLQSSIERTSNKMLDLRLKTKEAGDESKDTANKFDFNFKKMGNTVKKFAYSLIGLRSIYAVVSRASSAYLSQDTELAEKLKSVWVGLGSFLAPVLEFISNSLLKALGYLNVFIKALTGIDFLARANAKALKAQASAQKELNNQTYDFDVIRKQQDESSSGGGGIDGDGLFKIPELDEKVVKKLQDLAYWLKENWYWIKEVGKVLLLVFGASAIAKIVKNIATLLGASGLGGLSSILSAIATIGIIAIGVDIFYKALTGRELIEDVKTIIDEYNKLKGVTEQNANAEQKHAERIDETNQKLIESIEIGEQTDEQRQITTNYLKNQTQAIEEQIKNIEKQFIKTGDMKKQEEELSKELESNIQVYDALYKQNLLNDEETENYLNTIADLIIVKSELKQDTTDLKKKYYELAEQTAKNRGETYNYTVENQKLANKLSEMTRKPWNIIVDTTAETVAGKISRLSSQLSDLTRQTYTVAINAVEDVIRSNRYTPYATGGIVTQPTRALIGEAGYPEAVLPMTPDYLSTLAGEMARYGNNGGGNQPINIYFDGRLIQRQNASRENQRNFITNT